MIGIVLAGGYNTRLRPLTGDVPKALLPLGNTTPLDSILEKMRATRLFDRVIITVNAHYRNKFKMWGARSNFEPIDVIVEPHRMNEEKFGAVKALEFATRDIDDDCLAIACDNVFSSSLKQMISFFKAKGSTTIALYDIKDLSKASNFSVAKIDEESEITDFIEKPVKPRSSLVGTGIYLFPAKTLRRISEYITRGLNSDQPGRFIEWLYKVESVYGYLLEGYWSDIGTPEAYLEALRRTHQYAPAPIMISTR